MRSESKPNGRRYWIALGFIVAGVAAGSMHARAVDSGHGDVVVTVVRGAVAPPARVVNGVFDWVGGQVSWIFRGRASAEEIDSLRGEVAQLKAENARLTEARIDLDRLKQDLGFVHSKSVPPLAANVIARRSDPKFDTLMIDHGSSDGVHPNSVVVSRSALVGRVFEVTPNTASVLMLTDQNSGVGARVQHADSRAVGICKGDNTGELSLVYLPSNAAVKAGDVIVTSGLGGVYPAGILIGTVLSVANEEGNVQKTARVRPGADFDRLEEVYLLR